MTPRYTSRSFTVAGLLAWMTALACGLGAMRLAFLTGNIAAWIAAMLLFGCVYGAAAIHTERIHPAGGVLLFLCVVLLMLALMMLVSTP